MQNNMQKTELKYLVASACYQLSKLPGKVKIASIARPLTTKKRAFLES